MHLGPGTFIPDPADAGGGCLEAFAGIIGVIFLFALIGSSCSTTPKSTVPIQSPSQMQSQDQAVPVPVPPRSAIQFAPIGPKQFPSPSPTPVFLGREPTDGRQVFAWRGKEWFLLPPPPNRYAYLCVTNGLNWCWRNPPHAGAAPCTQRSTGLRGWCWR